MENIINIGIASAFLIVAILSMVIAINYKKKIFIIFTVILSVFSLCMPLLDPANLFIHKENKSTTNVSKEIVVKKDTVTVEALNQEKVENITGLYDISEKIVSDNTYISDISYFGKNMICVMEQDKESNGYVLKVYDYLNDKITGEYDFGSNDDQYFGYEIYTDNKEYIYVYDRSSKIIQFDKELKILKTFDFEGGYLIEYTNKDSVIGLNEDGNILEMNLDTGKIEEKTPPENIDLKNGYIDGYVDNDRVLFIGVSGYDEYSTVEYYVYYIDKNEIYTTSGDYYRQIYGDYIVINDYKDSGVLKWYEAGKERLINSLSLDSTSGYTEGIIDQSGKYILASDTVYKDSEVESINLDIYSMDSKTKISTEEINAPEKASVYINRGYDYNANDGVILCFYGTENTYIYIYQIGEIKDFIQADNYIPKDKEIKETKESEVSDKCQQISEKYGITIKYGLDAIRFFTDFAATPTTEEDYTAVLKSLNEIDEIFGRFPDGFLKEFQYDGIDGIEIYLTSTLIRGSEYGISSAAAYALQMDGKQMLVLDVTYVDSMKRNIAHEMSHAIDSKMDAEAYEASDEFAYQDWTKLSPIDYFYSYVNEYGEDINTYNAFEYTIEDPKSAGNIDNIYYVDGYGRTFPTEDRARIFEYLLGTDKDEQLPECFGSVNIQNKAKRMFEEIRKYFDSVDDSQMYWESWF